MKIDLEKFEKVLDEVDNREPDIELSDQPIGSEKLSETLNEYVKLGKAFDNYLASCGSSFQDGFVVGMKYAEEERVNEQATRIAGSSN